MPAGKNETVPSRPVRVLWIVAQVVGEEKVGNWRCFHGRAGMARLGPLNGIGGQQPQGVDRITDCGRFQI